MSERWAGSGAVHRSGVRDAEGSDVRGKDQVAPDASVFGGGAWGRRGSSQPAGLGKGPRTSTGGEPNEISGRCPQATFKVIFVLPILPGRHLLFLAFTILPRANALPRPTQASKGVPLCSSLLWNEGQRARSLAVLFCGSRGGLCPLHEKSVPWRADCGGSGADAGRVSPGGCGELEGEQCCDR